MFASIPLPELVARARTLFANAADPEVLPRLAPFGYAAADLEAGLDLIEEVEALTGAQQVEYAEQYEATEAVDGALAALDAVYTRHRKLARIAHPRASDGYRALGLAGTPPQAGERLVLAADTFYRALTQQPRLGAGIRGLNAAAVVDGRARVGTARTAMDQQGEETGEAQRATRVRDEAVARLRAQAAELAAVAKVALEDVPQTRERLGLLERS